MEIFPRVQELFLYTPAVGFEDSYDFGYGIRWGFNAIICGSHWAHFYLFRLMSNDIMIIGMIIRSIACTNAVRMSSIFRI